MINCEFLSYACKRPNAVGKLLTNYKSLAHREASSQQQRRYSGPCGHCVLCGNFGKHDANMIPEVTALHSKGKVSFKADANLH